MGLDGIDGGCSPEKSEVIKWWSSTVDARRVGFIKWWSSTVDARRVGFIKWWSSTVDACRCLCDAMINKWEEIAKEESSCEVDVWPHLQTMAHLIITAARSIYIPGSQYLPTKSNKRMKANYKEVKGLIKGIIDKRLDEMKEGKSCNDDLLGVIFMVFSFSNFILLSERIRIHLIVSINYLSKVLIYQMGFFFFLPRHFPSRLSGNTAGFSKWRYKPVKNNHGYPR